MSSADRLSVQNGGSRVLTVTSGSDAVLQLFQRLSNLTEYLAVWAAGCHRHLEYTSARSGGSKGKQHPDRDAQFRYINAQVTAFQDDGSPVISVDAR